MATASPDKKNPDSGYEPPAEGHVYASKTELLEWVNGLLELQLSKLEQFASGAVFCQMLDAYFSSAIPMHKVCVTITLWCMVPCSLCCAMQAHAPMFQLT